MEYILQFLLPTIIINIYVDIDTNVFRMKTFPIPHVSHFQNFFLIPILCTLSVCVRCECEWLCCFSTDQHNKRKITRKKAKTLPRCQQKNHLISSLCHAYVLIYITSFIFYFFKTKWGKTWSDNSYFGWFSTTVFGIVGFVILSMFA